MNLHSKRFLRIPLFACASALLLALPARADTITVGGTGASIGTMRLLAAEFAKVAPSHSLVVVPNLGTGGSMKALAAGAIDMAAISRQVKADEAAQGMVGVEYGRTPLVIATSTKGAGTIGSMAEFAEIHTGRKASWADGGPIRLVMRPQSDIDTSLLEAFSPEMKRAIPLGLARPGMVIAATDQEAADFIERTPGAIGITSLALVRTEHRTFNVLPLGGVVPSPRSLADGSYPYVKVMQLVRKGAGTPGVARFFEFIASPRGRQLLADTGHWVADGAAAAR